MTLNQLRRAYLAALDKLSEQALAAEMDVLNDGLPVPYYVPDPDDELFDKRICPRCGEYGDTTTIEDHGHCRDCHAQWQHGLLDDRDEDEDNHGSLH